MSIRYKMLSGFVVALGIIVAQVIVVNYYVGQLQKASQLLASLAAVQKQQLGAEETITSMRAAVERIPDLEDRTQGVRQIDAQAQQLRRIINSLGTKSTAIRKATEELSGYYTLNGQSVDGEDSRTRNLVLIDGIEKLSSLMAETDGALEEFQGAAAAGGDSSDQLFEKMIFLDEALQVLNEKFSLIGREVEQHIEAALQFEEEVHGRPSLAGLLVGGMGALILVLFSFWFSGRLVAPIKKMADSASRIAAGDIDQDLVYKDYFKQSNDEMGVLAKAFQEMTSSLRGVIDETGQLIGAARRGNLTQRGDVGRFQGVFADLIEGMNKTLDAVSAPINEAAAVLERVADQQLDARVEGDYEGDFSRIKHSLNKAVDKLEDALSTGRRTVGQLNNTLSEVTVSAEEVASASHRIGEISSSVSSGASSQAASTEEVLSSLQQMSSISKQNAMNASEARELTEKARSSAQLVEHGMQKLSEAINRIKESSDATAKIVKAIDEIAFQTNLLALNAAVEAARAGDAGKSFAVVAEEVRNLARRSAEAANDTANLIKESVSNAETGVAINHEVLESLAEIVAQVNRINEVVATEISTGSEQQSHGIAQINTAVEQINTVTQQTAMRSDELTGASEALKRQADNLRRLVEETSFQDSGSAGGQSQSGGLLEKKISLDDDWNPGSLARLSQPSNGRLERHELETL